jgi:hypothetical protein
VHFVLRQVDEHERQDKVRVLAQAKNRWQALHPRADERGARTPGDEIRRLTAYAGLCERDSKATLSLIMSRIYEAVVEKVSAAEP